MEQITYHDKFASSPFFGQVFVCVVCLPFCTLKGLIMKVLHSHTNLKIIENNLKNITNPIHGQSLSTFLCIISFDVLCILKNHYSKQHAKIHTYNELFSDLDTYLFTKLEL